MARARKFSTKVRVRAVRAVVEHLRDYGSKWAAIKSIVERDDGGDHSSSRGWAALGCPPNFGHFSPCACATRFEPHAPYRLRFSAFASTFQIGFGPRFLSVSGSVPASTAFQYAAPSGAVPSS